MTITLTLVGLILGMAWAGVWGATTGALIGFLLGQVSRLNRQVRALIADQTLLRKDLRQLLQQTPPAAAVSRSTAPEAPGMVPASSSARSPEPGPESTPEPVPEPMPVVGSLPEGSSLSAMTPEPTLATARAAVPSVESASGISPTVSAQKIPFPQEAAGSGSESGPVWGAPSSVDRDTAPDGLSQALSAVYRFLTEGNVVAKIGVIVLFFGLAFLLKYAADQNLFPIGLRLTLVGIGGLVLLGIGWRLREGPSGYALVLQGGGIGILYLVLFAAFRLYGLLPATVALPLMMGVVILAAALAVVQDARSLAVLGVVGGFLAPILTGSNSGRHVELFTFYLLLDVGIVLVAWFKAWRELNLLGFVFTFVIGTVWGVLKYRPELFASTEPFLIGFFVIFLVTAILFARRQWAAHEDYVQTSLVFGPPLVGFGLQVALVQHFAYGVAWSAFVLGAGYLLLVTGLRRRFGDDYRLLTDAFLALGIGFVSLAVPFAFDGQWTSTTWALEGAAMLWIGLRQGKTLPVVFGLLLQFGAGVAFGDDPPGRNPALPLLDAMFLSGALIALAGLFSAYLLRTYRGSLALFAWGLCWWFGVGFYELAESRLDFVQPFVPWLVFASLSLLVADGLRLRIRDWAVLDFIPAAQMGFMLLLGIEVLLAGPYPFYDGGWLAWPLAFGVAYGLLGWHERRDEPVALVEGVHGVGLGLFTALLAAQLVWSLYLLLFGLNLDLSLSAHGRLTEIAAPGAWEALGWGLVPALVLVWVDRAGHWPFGDRFGHAATYRGWVGLILAAYLLLWLVGTHGLRLFDSALGQGWSAPGHWGYLPLLNGVDLVTAVVFWAVFQHRRLGDDGLPEGIVRRDRVQQGMLWVMGGVAFLWLNAVLARSLNAFAALPLSPNTFAHSALAQTTYSIAWAVLGLVLILLASRWGRRPLWLVAAALLGVVVLKLFLVDLSGSDTLARIVSFVGVGVLLLLAGYVAPIPARQMPEDAMPESAAAGSGLPAHDPAAAHGNVQKDSQEGALGDQGDRGGAS
ncbi:hypothetical protein A9404_11805 [Halothiobacillus diazotrophicus]|uniref:DUF2339 domain-containing protein n=1 Tax=Halothiobacillus diazotrophicus TaxID=1860122 RepID=A0A191ZJF4_9GAMM|nr:DUF2339 domain-containing protein [Halothiobacillus diazotrophicus]ANJ67968.1 hypothetical protein A9404_11805 [Halothiobacillus diazotrophicus]